MSDKRKSSVKSIFKKSECSAYVRNPCKLCLQPVTLKNGVMCKGECRSWAHFKCLNYTPGKIKDIKKGVITVACPCPDCSLDPAKKEYLTKPPYRCNNDMCPANRPQVCAIKGCPNHDSNLSADEGKLNENAQPIVGQVVSTPDKQNPVVDSDPDSKTSDSSFTNTTDSSDTDTSVRYQVNQVQDPVKDIMQQQYEPPLAQPQRQFPVSPGRPSNIQTPVCNPEAGCNPRYPIGGTKLYMRPDGTDEREPYYNNPNLRTDFRPQDFSTQDYNDYRNPGFIENRNSYGYDSRNGGPPMNGHYEYNIPPNMPPIVPPNMPPPNMPMSSYQKGRPQSLVPNPNNVILQEQIPQKPRRIGSPACVCGRNVYYSDIINSRSDSMMNRDYNLQLTLENMQKALGRLNFQVQEIMRR